MPLSPVLSLIRQRARGGPAALPAAPLLRNLPGSTALVLDSPHSGTHYPPDFGHACGLAQLRRAEDTHVEKLFDFAPAKGIAWVEALFPRSYVDANRSLHELDPAMLDAPWPQPLHPDPAMQAKLRLGKGLVWRLTDEGLAVYHRKLSVAEVQQRLARCWHPYHQAVAQAVEAAHARHGFCIHVNCHSMPAVAGSHATAYPGEPHPDFVLGDRDGSTASLRLTGLLAQWLRARGHSVQVNHPYKGVELVRRHGRPGQGRHSVQLEINRSLYMDEATLALHAGCQRLRRLLQGLADALLQLRQQDL